MWAVISEVLTIVQKSTIPNFINVVRGKISYGLSFGKNWFGIDGFLILTSKLSQKHEIQLARLYLQILMILFLFVFVLLLEFHYNSCFICLYCIKIGIDPSIPVYLCSLFVFDIN